MDFPKIPRKLQEEAVIEGNIYFFEKNASFGIPGHMHVCIKRADRLLFFSTCSSQINTALQLAKRFGWDINTFPVYKANAETNQFKEPLTYVNYEQGETALIFDDCNLCNEAFPKLFDIFKNVEEDIQIPGLPPIYTWKNRILSVQKGLSHAQPLLQAADVLATSTDKVLQKCREDNMNFNDYECGILMLLAILYGEGNLWMVTSQKLKQHFGKATRIVSQLD
jgi:hypothetical protein